VCVAVFSGFGGFVGGTKVEERSTVVGHRTRRNDPEGGRWPIAYKATY
jgi:hypothetical protein